MTCGSKRKDPSVSDGSEIQAVIRSRSHPLIRPTGAISPHRSRSRIFRRSKNRVRAQADFVRRFNVIRGVPRSAKYSLLFFESSRVTQRLVTESQ
jgi:hypothetical protein